MRLFRKKRPTQGSFPAGPSPEYVRLLRGEINVKEYVRALEKRVKGYG